MKYDYPRLIAVRILHQVLADHAFSNEALAYHLTDEKLDRRDRAFVTAMVYGTLDYLPLLDYRLEQAASRPLHKLDPIVLQILRLGCYQIIFADKVPAAAAVNESVRLVRYFRKNSASGFVNAVLRRISRQLPDLPQQDLGIRLGLGNELFAELKQWYGFTAAEQIARSFLQPPDGLTVAYTGARDDRDQWLEALQREGVRIEPGVFFRQAFRLSQLPCAVPLLPGYAEGLFYVQDEASMLVPTFLQAQAGQSVLDGCAGLGGKTVALLSACPNLDVWAVEPSEPRYAGLLENLERLHLSRVRTLQANLLQLSAADFSDPDHNRSGLFDHVLLDVPCSGLGVLRHKPELKLRWNRTAAEQMIELQADLLRHAANLLRPGGRLVYSTCTLNPAENEQQIERFLCSPEGASFAAVPAQELLSGDSWQSGIAAGLRAGINKGMLLLRPDQTAADGFFIAALSKK